MSKPFAVLAAVAALSLAGAARAATVYTYDLDVADPAAGFGSVADFGTVTVADNGVDLFVSVALADGFEFRRASDSNHHDLTFKLDETGDHVSNLSFSGFHQDSGSAFHQAPFGQPGAPWNYAIDCSAPVAAGDGHPSQPGCKTGWNPANNPTAMSFRLAGVSAEDLASVPYTGAHGTRNIFFAVDVVNSHGYTGAVGATWDGMPHDGVPEPATWGLMILGFGAIGAALRRRRAAASPAA